MKSVFLGALLVTAGFAGAAAAAPRLTDTQYWQAAECAGLAAGLKVDSADIDRILRRQSLSRAAYVVDRAEEIRDQAKRKAQHANPYIAEQARTELASPGCVQFRPAY